jgi:cobalt-zinc-cadmium efflux system outer membrane protein
VRYTILASFFVMLALLAGTVGCTGSVQPCVDRHVCGIASTPLDATPVPQPNPIHEAGLSPISAPIPAPAPQIKREKQEIEEATPPTPVPPAVEQSFNPPPHINAGQVSDDRREPVPVSLKDGNVQIAFLDPAETSKPDEPQAKLRSRANPLAIPPDLPGAEAPAIRVPPFNAPKAERASAIEQIYRAMPELAGSELGQPESARTPLTLTELQQTAMCRNPLIRQAASDVEAARGQMIQAGTISNPHVSFEGDTMGTGNTGGYQGVNLQQSIPTGGKLRLAAAAAEMDLRNAELALRQARYDLATQVRTNYFAVLVAQENVKVSRALAQFAETTYRVQIGRVRAAEAAPYEPLLLRVQAVQARANLVQAQQAHAAAWRHLAATLSWPDLPLTPLVGNVAAPAPQISYEAALERLMTCHTSLEVARNGIEKARYQLELARRTPVIPNVDLSTVIQHDYTTAPFNTVWSLNVGAPIPVFDKNRGNIMAAEAALIRASSDVERASNDLRNQLADAYNNYAANEVTLKYYRADMIVDQVRAYRALYERYQEDPDKIDFVGDIVQQQQTLAQLITGYVQTLGNRWQAVVTLAGLLQVDDMWQMGQLTQPEALPAPKPAQDRMPLPPPEKPKAGQGG